MGLFDKPQKKGQPVGPQPDEIREQRIEEVRHLTEKVLYDIADLLAGNDPMFETYVAPQVAQWLRQSVAPFLATRDAMRPNYGDYAALHVEGNLVDFTQPIDAVVEFDDQSVRETADGTVIPQPKRRMRLSMTIDPSCRVIQRLSIEQVQQP